MVWRILAAFLLLMILGALLLPLDTAAHDRLQQAFWRFLHFPAMAVAVVLLAYVRSVRANDHLRNSFVLLLVAVPLIEALQTLTGRTASWGDVFMGWAGVLAGGAILYGMRCPERSRRLFAMLLVVGLSVGSLAPSMAVALDRRLAEDAFPLLASFSHPLETGRWTANGCSIRRSDKHADFGEYTLSVTFSNETEYPGVFMTDFQSDWSDAKALTLRIYLEGDDKLTGWIRIDDKPEPAYGDRFQQPIELSPGANTLRIELGRTLVTPRGRQLRADTIHTWGLFSERAAAGRTWYLDAAYLEHPE